MLYTNQEKIEAYLKRSLTAEELLLLDDIIEAVSQEISTALNRRWPDIDSDDELESTTKYYDCEGGRELFIDDVLEIDEIQLLDSEGTPYVTLNDVDFITYPDDDSPISSIYIKNYRIPCYRRGVKVTGVFYTGLTVPAEVTLAATQMAVMYMRNDMSTASESDFKKESIEGYSYERMSPLTGEQLTTSRDQIIARLSRWRKISL